MPTTLQIANPETPDDLSHLHALAAAQGAVSLSTLERHLARPRYRPAFTRIAKRAGQIAGYALIGHQRLRLGAATLEAGRIDALDVALAQDDPSVFAALLGDCLRVLVEEGLPLVLLWGPTETYAPFGFAPYRLDVAAHLTSR